MTMRWKFPPPRRRSTRWPRDPKLAPARCAGAFPEPSAASLPRPVSTFTAKSPRRRLRSGGDGASAQVLARGTAIGARWHGKVSMAPRRNGRGLWDYAPACCGRLCQSVPSSTLAVRRLYVTKDGSPTRIPASPMELPRHASSTSPQAAGRGVLACRWGVGLARVRAQAGAAFARKCRVGHVSIRDRRPVRPWFVVNPGEGTASPWASWPQPSSENNFPAAARLPRGTNSFRFQVLHCVATASGAAHPSPAGRITTRTHWRDLVQPERRKHHG